MTTEKIHKLPWKAQEYINQLVRKLSKSGGVKSFTCDVCLKKIDSENYIR